MKRLLSLVLFLSLISLVGCEDILECVINRRPELPDKSFKTGFTNQLYYEEFDAQIKNEPQDNAYGYNFEIEGELPDGIELFIDYRTLVFEGIPQSQGSFEFRLHLNVDPPLHYNEETEQYEDSMCSESTSRTYTITIN
ncbi:hypothetical protein [uncultured Lacinutrix sp.]|uniref:hypothetical protein n=1 Tax=uncultured Lacinutrix sp. TaxID=574032 RepID=UPI0026102BD4|nr:hypothetical protein [uncultured Lacinutrix sp.]